MIRTGLLFGSFNPVHLGHLVIAQHIINTNYCDQCWLVVSPLNPFKPDAELAAAEDRLAMARLAVSDNSVLAVSDLEFGLSLPSYTIHSLEKFRDTFSDREFSVIIGEDILPSFHRWKEYQKIQTRWPLLVFPRIIRGQQVDEQLYEKHGAVRLDAPRLDISATKIRELIATGKNPRYLVPDVVLAYIQDHALFS